MQSVHYGKHIALKKTKKSVSEYFNYKNSTGEKIQGAADHHGA